jgi:hypothetical protein
MKLQCDTDQMQRDIRSTAALRWLQVAAGIEEGGAA